MVGLIILGVVLCAAVVGAGIWLLVRALLGKFPLEKAIFKRGGDSIEGPVGFVMALAATLLAVWLVSRYEPAVEALNKQLTTSNGELKADLKATQGQRDGAEKSLREEKGKADELENQVRARTTDKEQAEAKLTATQGDLVKTKGELNDTQGRLANETARANDLLGKNATFMKQLSDEKAERREAEQQNRAAWQSANLLGLTEKQQAEFKNVQDGVLALNDALSVLKIAPAYWPRLQGKKAAATYEIFQKAFEADQMRARGAGLLDFDSQKYTVKGDYQGRLAAELQTKISMLICEIARRAIVEKVPLPEAIKNMPPIREYDLDPQLIATLAEFEYVRMRLQILAGRAVVLVRGYADGEQGPWRRGLDPSLATVRLHESVDPNAKQTEYAMNFRADQTQISVGQPGPNGPTYGNDDLPNLRGEETSEILSALVGSCPQVIPNTVPGDIPVEVLQGRVYPQHSEIDRKARVHLLVFLKD
jgi:hypothetical protein